MGIELLTERYKDQIAGVLSCYDRIIIQGTVPGWCYASGMTSYFYEHQMRIFDYPKWAEPLRDALRKNMEQVAADNAIGIEFVRSAKKFRKEKRVKEIRSSAASSRAWFVSCLRWSHVAAISRGTTRRATRRI